VDNPPKIYLDACCFIEAASHIVGKHKPNRDKDVKYIRGALQAHQAEQLQVFTSILSIAESQCVTDPGGKLLTDEIKALFKAMLTSGQYLSLIQPTVLIGEKARNLYWVHNLSFGGADALHLASALEFSCDEFWTFDGRPEACKRELDALGLKVCIPQNSLLVPEEFRPDALPLFEGVPTNE
jgi:hypothetical protein